MTGEPWHSTGNMNIHGASVPSGLSFPVTINPLPLSYVTIPTPHDGPLPATWQHQVILTQVQGQGGVFQPQGPVVEMSLVGSTVNYIQNMSKSQARQRKTSEQRGTIAGLLQRQRGAQSQPRGSSFECMALLSTHTKTSRPWDLIFLDTWPLILGLRPFTSPRWRTCQRLGIFFLMELKFK